MTVTEVEFNEVVEKINNLPKEGPQLAEDIRLKVRNPLCRKLGIPILRFASTQFYGYYKQGRLQGPIK
jgi:hypothetical protein